MPPPPPPLTIPRRRYRCSVRRRLWPKTPGVSQPMKLHQRCDLCAAMWVVQPLSSDLHWQVTSPLFPTSRIGSGRVAWQTDIQTDTQIDGHTGTNRRYRTCIANDRSLIDQSAGNDQRQLAFAEVDFFDVENMLYVHVTSASFYELLSSIACWLYIHQLVHLPPAGMSYVTS